MASAVLFNRLDDFLNPIAVKEMRQAVKGRFIVWTLLFFLIVQVGVAAGTLLFGDMFREVTGPRTFMIHLGILLGTCLLYLPASTALRFSSERAKNSGDLLFTTALRPVQIIWGKTLAAVILMVVFFSAAMPFLTLTYLLRGVDIPTMFVLLAIDIVAVIFSIQFGVIYGTTPGTSVSQIVHYPTGLLILGVIYFFTMQNSYELLSSGVGSSIGTFIFWVSAAVFAIASIMALVLLFILSVIEISPRSANKALALRIYLLSVWFVSGVVCMIASFPSSDYRPLMAWRFCMTILFSIVLFFSLFEREEPGPRVMRSIPKIGILRCIAFFLYSGVAGGVSFSLVMIALTLLSSNIFLKLAPVAVQVNFRVDEYSQIVVFAVNAIGYSLTALTIKRFFFRRSKRPALVSDIILILLVALNVIPLFIGYLLHPGGWDTFPFEFMIANPLIGFVEKKSLDYLYINAAWACIVIAVSLPWLFDKFHQFQSTVPAQEDLRVPVK